MSALRPAAPLLKLVTSVTTSCVRLFPSVLINFPRESVEEATFGWRWRCATPNACGYGTSHCCSNYAIGCEVFGGLRVCEAGGTEDGCAWMSDDGRPVTTGRPDTFGCMDGTECRYSPPCCGDRGLARSLLQNRSHRKDEDSTFFKQFVFLPYKRTTFFSV